MKRRLVWRIVVVYLVFAGLSHACAQEKESSRLSFWFPLQALPSVAVLSTPAHSSFAFEWEVSPLLYSFGMSRLASSWQAFLVYPPARFSGSVELLLSGQLYTTKVGSSYFSRSIQLRGHIPLIERGEHLALILGVASYRLQEQDRIFGVGGVSTLFGFVSALLKYSPPDLWMGSLEFRIF